jgi:hypothetical protein
MASGLRLNMGNQMVVVWSPGGRRRDADGEHLRRSMTVNIGGTTEESREIEEMS